MTKILIIFCCVFLSIKISSAQLIVDWQKTLGGIHDDRPHNLLSANGNGYLISGFSLSGISGIKTSPSYSGSDYWVIKTDPGGNIVWQKTYGGSATDILLSADETSDGGFILGGESDSPANGNKTESNVAWYDYWVIKIDSLGNIEWQNDIGGDRHDRLRSVIQTQDGGYLAAGYSHSHNSFDKTDNCINDSYDSWIVKLDASGNIMWDKTIGGTSDEDLCAAIQTSDGGYLLGVTYFGISSGYYIVKLDTAGNVVWGKIIGGSSADELISVVSTSDGGYALLGRSNSMISGDKTEDALGAWDYWIVKVDSGGLVQWDNTLGGNMSDMPESLIETVDGGYLLAGKSQSGVSGDKSEPTYGGLYDYDFWLVKLDSSGLKEWDKTIGGNSSEGFLGGNGNGGWGGITVVETGPGKYALSGASISGCTGDKTENNYGDVDMWLIGLHERFNLIEGNLFADLNSNGVADSGDVGIENKMLYESVTDRIAFSQRGGAYRLVTLDSGNFLIHPPSVNYFTAQPADYAINFTSILQTDSLNDFAYQAINPVNDVCVKIIPTTRFRSGMTAQYVLNYYNSGNTIITPTVILFPDANLSFTVSNPAASFVTPDSIIWNLPPLAPFQSRNIFVTVSVNAGLVNGTPVYSSVRIEPVAGDADPACNTDLSEVFVTGSYDPNNILVSRDTLYLNELASPPYLYYQINFQNTGNDTAFTIRIHNQIPSFLNLMTFELLSSSHPLQVVFDNPARLMRFNFDNILLPDYSVDEPGSHGYILYRIKPLSSLAVGDSIVCNAGIYFDFNAPVLTNDAVTRITLNTSVTSLQKDFPEIILYPNPAHSEISLSFHASKNLNCSLHLFDLTGRQVLEKSIKVNAGENNLKIDLQNMTAGLYTLLLNGESYSARVKVAID